MNWNILKALWICVVVGSLTACGGGSGTRQVIVTTTDDPDNATETVSFDISDFSEVSVGGPFNVSILQSDDVFAVQVTVDGDAVHMLDVRRTGPTLSVGLLPGGIGQVQTLEVVVNMPTLTAVKLAGATNAMFAGFSNAFLEVDLEGASFLEGFNVRYDLVTVKATGASVLLLEEVHALPAAHAELTGASTATFNLMNGATLTGAVTNASALLYYGSGVVVQVDATGVSSVLRLGDTRP